MKQVGPTESDAGLPLAVARRPTIRAEAILETEAAYDNAGDSTVITGVAGKTVYVTEITLYNTGIAAGRVTFYDGSSGGTAVLRVHMPINSNLTLRLPPWLPLTAGNGLIVKANAANVTGRALAHYFLL